MKVSKDESGNLIVTNVETFVRALLGAFGVGIVAAWVAPIPTRQTLGWSVVCGVFVVALLVANERSTFVFDRGAGILRWSQDTPFRHLSGEVPFASITALSIERDFRFRSGARSSQGRGGARRLVLLTTSGVIPFTAAYTGVGSDAQDVGREVQKYLGEVAPGPEIPLRSP
jgi:hypothetical protein